VHFSVVPAEAWTRFRRDSCDFEARLFLAQLVKAFEVFLCGYFHVDFRNITLDLREALEDVAGIFRYTGDEVVFFRVHECFARWAWVIHREEHDSPVFHGQAGLVGDMARQLLVENIKRLLTADDSSPFPHFPDYAALGKWASMTAPF
jgi:hypothetical protein